MNKPAWIEEAEKYIGVKEIPGLVNEPKIVQWWKAIKRGGIKNDEVPWCAAFVGACLENVGIQSSRFESAKSYMNWGDFLPSPTYGCIVMFERTGGGHIGFVVGKDKQGRLLVLGGNQGNQVSISPFDMARVSGYRWPNGYPIASEVMPSIASNATSSVNEA